MKLYDEKEAVDYIKAHVGIPGLNEDTILEIIDAIYDFYDDNGDLDLDFDDNDDELESSDEADVIISYVSTVIDSVDKNTIARIVEAEIDYETSLL